MQTWVARVRNGRLVMDEETELPEGTEVHVAPVIEGDDFDNEDQAKLDAALEEAMDDAEAGRVVSEAEFRAALRAAR